MGPNLVEYPKYTFMINGKNREAFTYSAPFPPQERDEGAVGLF